MKTVEEKLTWVLRFIEMDLSQQSEKEWLQLQTDIQAFVKEVQGVTILKGIRIPPEDLLTMQRDGKDLLQDAGLLSLTKKIGDRSARRISRDILKDVSPPDLMWDRPLQSVWGLRLVFSPNGNGMVYLVADLPETFLFALAQALVAVRLEQLSQCPECERPYFTTHGHQLFCSTKCKNRWTLINFRKRKRQEKAAHKKAGARAR